MVLESRNPPSINNSETEISFRGDKASQEPQDVAKDGQYALVLKTFAGIICIRFQIWDFWNDDSRFFDHR